MEKIDLKDKKILYELDLDSRQSNKQIAKKVGLSEQVTGNRINSLIKKNIIDYFYVKTNPTLLGYFHVKTYIRWQKLIKEKETLLLNELNNKNGIYWMASLRGKYDFVASIYVKNMAEFSERYDDIFNKYIDYIADRNIIVLEKAYTYSKAFLLEDREAKGIVYSLGKEKKVILDEKDKELLRILNKDGRASLLDIAKKLNVSSDTIRYRINNLKKSGLITGFGVKVNFEIINYEYSIISLKLQNMDNEKYKRLETFCKLNKNVVIFIKTVGDHDVELEVETKNRNELDELIKNLRDSFILEIKDYEIFEVIKEYRMTYYPF